MILRISILLAIVFMFFSCRDRAEPQTEPAFTKSAKRHNSKHIIAAEELKTVIKEGRVKIIDFRKSEEYQAGHIPNALNIWRSDIEDKNYQYKGMAAQKEALEAVLSSLGITADDHIVIYDDSGLCDASRLWWILKIYNFNAVQLLNGGWADWKLTKGSISEDTQKIAPSEFKFTSKITNNYLIDKDSLSAHLANEDVILIDSRTADEFSGKRQKSGAKRSGRIPGSMNIDWMVSIESNSKKFKSRSALEKIYAQAGSNKNAPIVVYCHTGVRSAHTTFVLTELLGYTNVKNYDGSWSEWSYYQELPIKKDSVTTVLN